jgi:phosphate:Na+ symporter
MGVAILLPLIRPFTKVIERIVPERVSVFARSLDPAALTAAPTVAVEAVRRTVARVLDALCSPAHAPADGATVREASAALDQARDFLSKVTGPLVSEQEQRWLISTVHALDHTARLVEVTQESAKIEATLDSPDERRAVKLYAEAMRTAAEAAGPMARASVSPFDAAAVVASPGDAVKVETVERLGRCAQELAGLRAEHRQTTLDSVASGTTTANDAIAQVDAIRMLDQRAHHAWRATVHLAAAVA